MTEKKALGQFFTNPIIAKFMVELVDAKKAKTFLDPSIGMGIFTNFANQLNENLQITACEVDSKIISDLKKDLTYSLQLFNEDYLTKDFSKKFDVIVCNPPYNKFQEIPNRKELIKLFAEKYNISLSGYSNLCVYFLVKSINELKKNGKCCYIIPYEFLNTGYGERIKKYLLESKMLKSIIKFNNDLKLFDEAITTSCILLLENRINEKVEFVNIDCIEELNKQGISKKSKKIKYSDLDPRRKWLQYFDFTAKESEYHNLIKVSEIAKVSRGIATGSNEYFTLNRTKINDYKLSEQVCIPCITKSPDINGLFVNKEIFDALAEKDKKVFLFDGSNSRDKEDFDYIRYGEEKNVDKTFLTSHRNPWYSIENKKPAPILLSVFSRNKIKVVRNEMMIKSLTTFHGMHFKDYDEEKINLLFCYLLTPLAQKILYKNKREYGEGLDKFEPNDLNTAYVLDVDVITKKDRKKIADIYEELKHNSNNQLINNLDSIYSKYVY